MIASIDLNHAIPVPEAARRLSVSDRRIRQLLGDGVLPASKVGGRWLVDGAAVDQRRRQDPGKSRGRRLSPKRAWGLIALSADRRPAWLDASSRSRLRRMLRERDLSALAPYLSARAQRMAFRAHPSDLPRLIQEPGVVKGGASAAPGIGLPYLAPGFAEAYVSPQTLERLRRRYRLVPSPDANVVLRVPIGPWPFEKDDRVAPGLAVALDLLDAADERARSAAVSFIDSWSETQRGHRP